MALWDKIWIGSELSKRLRRLSILCITGSYTDDIRISRIEDFDEEIFYPFLNLNEAFCLIMKYIDFNNLSVSESGPCKIWIYEDSVVINWDDFYDTIINTLEYLLDNQKIEKWIYNLKWLVPSEVMQVIIKHRKEELEKWLKSLNALGSKIKIIDDK